MVHHFQVAPDPAADQTEIRVKGEAVDTASVADDASHNFEIHGKKHKVSGVVARINRW